VSRRALGKGLDALIPDVKGETTADRRDVIELDIDQIAANPYQPRTRMSEISLDNLKESIGEKGVLQPVIVRKKSGRYEVVAGERRLRAAKLAKLKTIPALVRQVSDVEALEIALVENLQREDLNPIDEARGYRELIKRFSLTQDELSRKIAKDRSTIANVLRLLNLPEEVKQGLQEGRITIGHARALLGLSEEKHIRNAYRTILHRGLSVRQVEALVRRKIKSKSRRAKPHPPVDPEMGHIEESLMRKLGTRVKIIAKGAHGKIEIEFYSKDDLSRILDSIG
jgi:ParB family chromosome partitioning protein